MSEHTPGPWRHADDGRLGCVVKDTPEGEVDIAMAQMRSRLGRKDPERAANARLIAAAPALLAALEEIVRRWDAYYADDGSVSPHDYFSGAEMEAARDAVQKAKGGPS